MHQDILIEVGNGVITADYYCPPKGRRNKNAPLIIMPSGFQKTYDGTRDLFIKISEKAERLGLSSLHYDYSRHLKSGIPKGGVSIEHAGDDLNNIFMWAQQNGFRKLAFITEGLGAPLVLLNMPENAIFSILFWPVFDLVDFATTQQVNEKSAYETADDSDEYKDYSFLKQVEDIDLTPCMNDAKTPTLILQGMKDSVVPVSNLEIARKSLMAPRLDITVFDDGEHGLGQPNHEEACLQHVGQFIKAYEQYDPSNSNKKYFL